MFTHQMQKNREKRVKNEQGFDRRYFNENFRFSALSSVDADPVMCWCMCACMPLHDAHQRSCLLLIRPF